MKFLLRWARVLCNYLTKLTSPDLEELILHLTLHTASLELAKNEYIELAPCTPGQCGPFKLYGNSLPVFEYVMFEKSIMEFIHVRVEVSRKPLRIQFIAKISSTTAPERDGEEVEVKGKYKAPFNQLIYHLFHYFPYTSSKYSPTLRYDKALSINEDLSRNEATQIKYDLLSEIDALRAELEDANSENYSKEFNEAVEMKIKIRNERDQLRERVAKLREALTRVLYQTVFTKEAHGHLKFARDALNEDDEAAK